MQMRDGSFVMIAAFAILCAGATMPGVASAAVADDDSIVLLEFVATELPEMSALVLALGRPETARLAELGRHATRTLEL